jgi:transcriptional regulator GlxA family with amidase domain
MSSVPSLLERVRLTEKQKLDELCQWLLDHLHERIGWSVLAQRSMMSNEELHRMFMLHYNQSPMQWISEQREKLVHAHTSHKVVNIESRRLHG